MSSNQYLIGASVRHQIFMQRRAGGIYNDLIPLLNSMQKDIIARLNTDLTDFQLYRLRSLQVEIDSIITEYADQITGQLSLDFNDLSEYEVGFTQRMLNTAVTVQTAIPAAEQIASIVTDTPIKLISGKATKQFVGVSGLVDEFERSIKREIAGQVAILPIVQSGAIEGATTDEIVRNITRITGKASKAHAKTVVRTATNSIGSEARKQTYIANADILEGEEFIATLDSRTTAECSGFDSEVFDVGVGPYPPLHYGCRSVRVPKIKDGFKIPGLEGERASVSGPVSASKTFGGFLRDQSAEFQQEYFSKFKDGDLKYELWKKGGLPIGKFTDAEGAAYTADELRALEPMAFEKAGL